MASLLYCLTCFLLPAPFLLKTKPPLLTSSNPLAGQSLSQQSQPEDTRHICLQFAYSDFQSGPSRLVCQLFNCSIYSLSLEPISGNFPFSETPDSRLPPPYSLCPAFLSFWFQPVAFKRQPQREGEDGSLRAHLRGISWYQEQINSNQMRYLF